MFKVGDAVLAMYYQDPNGTVLGPGLVERVIDRPDGWFTVEVLVENGSATKTYHVSPSGHSDYLMHA